MIMLLAEKREIYSVRETKPTYEKVLEHVMNCEEQG